MIIFFISLFTICFSLVACEERSSSREFFNGFFQGYNGNNVELNDECFADDFKAQLDLLKSALKHFHFKEAFEIFLALKFNASSNCPVNDFIEIQKKLLEKLINGDLVSSITRNSPKFVKIALTLATSFGQRISFVLGKVSGELVKIVLSNQVQSSLNFLSEESNLDDFNMFFNGFLTGVSTVPFEDNKCYKDISGSLADIEKCGLKIYEAVMNKSPREFSIALGELTASLIKIKGFDSNCHVIQLIKNIGIYSSGYTGLAKLFFNITKNSGEYFNLTKDMYKAIESKSFENAGVTSGKIAGILLSWETN